jgi:hypothetical protein
MLFYAFLAPPLVEFWISVGQAVEKSILMIDFMSFYLGSLTAGGGIVR